MKKLIIAFLALGLLSFNGLEVKLTDAEREMAANEMSNTRDHMMKVLDGLSEAQLNFKSSEDSWSIAECVEHLAISEEAFGGMLQAALEKPADESLRAEVKMSDEELLAIIRDRTNKVKTSEPFEPSGKFGSYMETLQAFADKREEHIKYIKTTQDDLRYHYGQLPFGTIDGFQMLLFASGHTERHVKQMEEVMAHEDFPAE